MGKIQFKRGLEMNLPTLDVAEPAFTTDSKKPFIGSGTGNIELAKRVDLDASLSKINSLETGASLTNANKIQGKSIPAPTSANDQQVVAYDNATGAFKYVTPASGSGSTSTSNATAIQGKNVPAPTAAENLKVLQYNNTSGSFQYASLPAAAGGNVNIESYGAVSGNSTASVMTANVNAINNMISQLGYAVIPPKVYWINGTINVTGGQQIIGNGFEQSLLYLPAGANYPAISVTKVKGARIGGFGIVYNDFNMHSYPNRNAIYCYEYIRDSEFHDMSFQNVYRAIHLDDTTTYYSNLWSCNFRNMRCYGWAKNFISLSPKRGGNTGSVFENIYVENGLRGSRYSQPGQVAFDIHRTSESAFIQINVEWSDVRNAFFIESCRNITMTSVHFEGIDSVVSGEALIHVSDSRVHITGLDVYNCVWRTGGTGAILQLNYGSDLKVDGLSENPDPSVPTLQSGTLRGIISDSVGNDRIVLDGVRANSGYVSTWIPSVNTNPSSGKPKLVKFNDTLYYYEMIAPDGSKWKANISNIGALTWAKI